MNLLVDLKEIVRAQLTARGAIWSHSDDAERLLLRVLNLESKTLSANPRRVHFSAEFETQRAALTVVEKVALRDIIREFENGDDVNAHLSKASVDTKITDQLLAHWGIHHIHISNWKDKPGDYFYARTGPLIFALVGRSDVYFLEIYPHGKGHAETWTRQELLKTVEKNWPALLDCVELNDAIDLGRDSTDQDLIDLRKANINVSTKVAGRIVGPLGGGVMGDGTPLRQKVRAMKTIKAISELENDLETHRTEIAESLGFSPADLDFQLVAGKKGWEVQEKRTGTIVRRINRRT
jgi:hypothetical protein